MCFLYVLWSDINIMHGETRKTRPMIVMLTSLSYSSTWHKAKWSMSHQQLLFLCCKLLRKYRDWVYLALPVLFQAHISTRAQVCLNIYIITRRGKLENNRKPKIWGWKAQVDEYLLCIPLPGLSNNILSNKTVCSLQVAPLGCCCIIIIIIIIVKQEYTDCLISTI